MKKLLLVLGIVITFYHAYSQRTWFDAEFTTNIAKKLKLSVSPEIRFKENFELNEYFVQTEFEYKFNIYFKLGAGYRFGYNIKSDDEHESFGRFNVDAKTGFKWKRFNPKFRLRYTNTDDFADDNETTNYLRYRLELEYNIKKVNFEPYVLTEWYHNIDIKEISKSRIEGGLMYKLNKHHKVGVYYRVNKYLKGDKDNRNIVGVSYKFSL